MPKIVIPVHFAGQSCHMSKIKSLSLKFGFSIIEDASHAIGSRYLDNFVGGCQYSDITVFSFHPVKIITTAEGGAAVTNNNKLARLMYQLRTHGITKDKNYFTEKNDGPWYYEQNTIGYNYRLTNLQAAVGVAQLERSDHLVSQKRWMAEIYAERLRDSRLFSLPGEYGDVVNSYWLYTIYLKNKLSDKLYLSN